MHVIMCIKIYIYIYITFSFDIKFYSRYKNLRSTARNEDRAPCENANIEFPLYLCVSWH